LTLRFPDLNRRQPLLAIDSEGYWSENRLGEIGADGREDLPVETAMLTAVQSDQRLTLFLGSLFVNNRVPHAVTLVNRPFVIRIA
jgi:hypothetical protein